MSAAAPRVVVGVTGATGAIYARAAAPARCARSGVETHLVATPAGVLNVHHELGLDRKALEALADASPTTRPTSAPHRQRLVRDRRDGRRAVLDEDARGDRARPVATTC